MQRTEKTKMGWSNFIILSEHKLAFEVSRNVNKEDIDKGDIEEFLKVVDDFNYETLEREYRELTISDLAELINIVRKAMIFADAPFGNFLVWYLELTGMKYEIISEFEFEEREKEFKKWKIIRR